MRKAHHKQASSHEQHMCVISGNPWPERKSKFDQMLFALISNASSFSMTSMGMGRSPGDAASLAIRDRKGLNPACDDCVASQQGKVGSGDFLIGHRYPSRWEVTCLGICRRLPGVSRAPWLALMRRLRKEYPTTQYDLRPLNALLVVRKGSRCDVCAR